MVNFIQVVSLLLTMNLLVFTYINNTNQYTTVDKPLETDCTKYTILELKIEHPLKHEYL